MFVEDYLASLDLLRMREAQLCIPQIHNHRPSEVLCVITIFINIPQNHNCMVQSAVYKARAWDHWHMVALEGVSFEFFKWGMLYFGRGTLEFQNKNQTV